MGFALSKSASIILRLVAVSTRARLRQHTKLNRRALKGADDLDLERRANTTRLKSKGRAYTSENLMKATVAVDSLFQL